MSAYMAMSVPRDRRILPHKWLWSFSNIVVESAGTVSHDPVRISFSNWPGAQPEYSHEGAKISQGRRILYKILQGFHVATQVDAVKDVVGVLGPLGCPIEDQEVILLDRSSGKDFVVLAFQDRDLWEHFSDIDLRLSIDDDPRALLQAHVRTTG